MGPRSLSTKWRLRGSPAVLTADSVLPCPLQKIDPEVAAFLQKLRSRVQIGVVGGSDYSKIAEQLGEGDGGRTSRPEPAPEAHRRAGVGEGSSGGPQTPSCFCRGRRGNSQTPSSLSQQPCREHLPGAWLCCFGDTGRERGRQNPVLMGFIVSVLPAESPFPHL